MKFAAIAAVALASGSVVDAQTLARCETTMLAPWNIGTSSSTCYKEAAYLSIQYLSPTDAILARFCPNQNCRTMVSGVLPLRPAAGDCTITRGGKQVAFFGEIVDLFAAKCEISAATTAPPATSTPAPPATMTPAPPVTTTPTPPVTTTPAPPVTTTPAPPATTTPAPPVTKTPVPPATTTPAPPATTTPVVTTVTPPVTTAPTPTSSRPAC